MVESGVVERINVSDQVHNLLICFSPFFSSQKKLDQGKSIELSQNYIQISDGTGNKQGCFFWKIEVDCLGE